MTDVNDSDGGVATLTKTRPTSRLTGQTESDFYLDKQKRIAIRHVLNDKLIAIIEIVSPGNKSSSVAVDDFCSKICSYLMNGIHVSFVDPFAPTNRDPAGLHGEIWLRMAGKYDELSTDEPLCVVSYESNGRTEFFMEPFRIGQPCPSMPVLITPGAHISVPMNETYDAAFAAVPKRWRDEMC